MEFGRYLVLSTAHIPHTVAELLEQWSEALPSDRPMAVAPTQFGWFVSTREVSGPDREKVPAELEAILRVGQAHGCDFVLLDCDAGTIGELPIFDW